MLIYHAQITYDEDAGFSHKRTNNLWAAFTRCLSQEFVQSLHIQKNRNKDLVFSSTMSCLPSHSCDILSTNLHHFPHGYMSASQSDSSFQEDSSVLLFKVKISSLRFDGFTPQVTLRRMSSGL